MRRLRRKSNRAHTPLTSQAEAGLYGAAYGAKKKGEAIPSYVPRSIGNLPQSVLRSHLKEKGSKKLPYHVKKKKKK